MNPSPPDKSNRESPNLAEPPGGRAEAAAQFLRRTALFWILLAFVIGIGLALFEFPDFWPIMRTCLILIGLTLSVAAVVASAERIIERSRG